MILGRARKRQSSTQFPWKSGIKVFLFILLLLASIFSVNQLKETQQFPIKQVKIYGAKHLDRQNMQNFLQPLVSKGFFAVEIDSIKERIMQMPWASEVSVRRVWPDQIMITIAERDAIARWNTMGLLSANGEIFNPDVNTYPTDLPTLIGPDGTQIQMLQFYSKINNLLQPLHLKIARLELTSYLSWNVVFNDGMKVNVGYKDVLTRINHFVKVYPKIVGKRATDVDYVDLRYPNGLAVRWKTV